jgi:hypothetical protein
MIRQRDGWACKRNSIGVAVFGLRLGCALVPVLASISMTINHGAATEVGGQSVSSGIAFKIPSQPLGTAIEAYARLSSREVLYDGALAAGRRSSLVDGIYTPEVALQILLAGTGLWADFKDASFFVVGLASTGTSASAAPGRQPAETTRYYARLQADLKTAFCANRVLPDGDRVAARLWIGQQGDVLQVKRLASSGSGELDQQVESALLGLKLGGPPPVGFEQPITIVIMPDDATQDCGGARRLSVRSRP